jgi:hypothetical protein
LDFERVIKTYGEDMFRYAIADRNGIKYINYTCKEHLVPPIPVGEAVSDIDWAVEYENNEYGFDVPHYKRSWFRYTTQ